MDTPSPSQDSARVASHHSAAATISHRASDTGNGRLDVRCPNCRTPMEVAVDTQLTDLTCSACGSHFSLVDHSQETRFAPTLTKLGRFELVERIGVGGFGSVWKARDKELDRTVAIKIPRQSGMSAEEQEMFFREARAAAQLRHPNIVSVHEVGRDGDSIYIVSDFVRGVTLADWMSGQKLTSREAAELCAKIAEALEHAHENGVVHRDLKPANIMIDGDGEPHLMDFGLARREAGEVTVTADGQILGTPAYMSPEQAEGKGHAADRRSDVYSLGVVLFQLLTGELPFRGNARMIMHQVINDDAPNPRKLNSNIARDLETIVLKCLKKEPSRRYQTCQELSGDLRRFLAGEPILARPVGRAERMVRWIRRNRTVAALSSAVALALLLGTVASTYFAIDARRQANVAITREQEAEAVTELLVESFESANPYQGGSTVTAAELLEHAQQRLDIELAKQPLARAALLDALGRALLGLGKTKEATEALTKAMETREKLLGPAHPDTLTTTNNLGDAYYEARRIKDAVKLFERTLATRRKVLGLEHVDTLTSAHDLAVAVSSTGDRSKAITLHEQNLVARQRVLGPDHPDTLKTKYNLATTSYHLGNFPRAVELFKETLAARRKVLGDDHPDTLRSMNGLADVYMSTHQRDDAIVLYQECLAGRIRKLGAKHQHTAVAMKGLADVYVQVGRVDEAIPLYEKCFANRRDRHGHQHAATRSVFNALLSAYSDAGRHHDAIKLLAAAFVELYNRLGVDDDDTVGARNALTSALVRLGGDEATSEMEKLAADRDLLGSFPAADVDELFGKIRRSPILDRQHDISAGQWNVKYYACFDPNLVNVPKSWTVLQQYPVFQQTVERIDFSWKFKSPSRTVPVDYFITVATTSVDFPSGAYRFETLSDDGVRVWVDDRLLIDNWTNHAPTLDSAELTLDKRAHSIRIEHFEGVYEAALKFGISRLGE